MRGSRSRTTASNWRTGPTKGPEPVLPDPMPQQDMEVFNSMLQGSMDGDMDQSMETSSVMSTEMKKKPWEKGNKIKKKKVPGAKNVKIRKYVQPKNAVMCLNELKPGITYLNELSTGVGIPLCVSVEVDGQNYRGFGSSKSLAKQAAAEAALISFVKPPSTTSETTDDKTPWATLASFAIYKLFNEWKEGRVGICPPTSPFSTGVQTMQVDIPQLNNPANHLLGAIDAKGAGSMSSGLRNGLGSAQPIIAHDSMVSRLSDEGAGAPKPAKALPDNASEMHPVAVLHQMKPNVKYNVENVTRDTKKFFLVSSELDGTVFTGEGQKVKKAKFLLAKQAIKILYDVDTSFEMTN